MLIKAMIFHEVHKYLTYLDFGGGSGSATSESTISHFHVSSQIQRFLLKQRQRDAIMTTNGGIHETDSESFHTRVMAPQSLHIQFLNEDSNEWREMEEFADWIQPRLQSHMIYCSFRTQRKDPRNHPVDSPWKSTMRRSISHRHDNDSSSTRRETNIHTDTANTNRTLDTMFGDEDHRACMSNLKRERGHPLHGAQSHFTSFTSRDSSLLSENHSQSSVPFHHTSRSTGLKNIAPSFLNREKVVGGKPQHFGPLLEKSASSFEQFQQSAVTQTKSRDFSSSYLSSLLKSVPEYSSSVLQLLNSHPSRTKTSVPLDDATDEFKQSRTHEKLKSMVLSQKLKRKRLLDERPSWNKLRNESGWSTNRRNIADARNSKAGNTATDRSTLFGNSGLRFDTNRGFFSQRNRAPFQNDESSSEDLPSSTVSEISSSDCHDMSFVDDSIMREFYNIIPEPFVDQKLSVKPKFVSPRVERVKRVTEPLERVLMREEDERQDPYKTPYKSYVDYYYDHHLAKAPSLVHRSMVSGPPPENYGNQFETFAARRKVPRKPWESREAFETCSDDGEVYVEESSPQARREVFREFTRKQSLGEDTKLGKTSMQKRSAAWRDETRPNPYMRPASAWSNNVEDSNSNKDTSRGFRTFRPYNTILGTLEEDDQRVEMQRYYEMRRRGA